MGKIVVGVDGSSGGEAALRWAADEARLRGNNLEIVCAWQLPLSAGPLYFQVEKDLQTSTEELAARARAAVDEQLGAGTVEVAATATAGPAHRALLDAADGADLLVVGSHGHGALSRLLLGSVSLHCVAHSPCPVVVVRGAEQHG